MTMYLLDTNHCSLLVANDPMMQRRVATSNQPIVTSVIVRGELVFMAENSAQSPANMRHVLRVLDHVTVLQIDATIADWYGALRAALLRRFGPKDRAKRRTATLASLGVSDNDLWIAATAKRYHAIIVSHDADFTRIAEVTDLQLESWIASPT
jgi:tRNA(fMet)-specific endonuclease VapC